MQQYNANSYLFGGNAPYVEELYEAYLNNPGSVPDNWRAYFDAMQHMPAVDGTAKPDVDHSSVIASFAEAGRVLQQGRGELDHLGGELAGDRVRIRSELPRVL